MPKREGHPLFTATVGAAANASKALALVFSALLMWSGCDATGAGNLSNRPVEHQGVTYRAVGDAVVSDGPRGTRTITSQTPESGVMIETKGYRRGDLFFKPVEVGKGGVFSIELVGKSATPLARVLHRRADTGEKYRLGVDLSGLAAKSFTLELRDSGTTVYRKENIRLEDGTTNAATSDREPTSYHYIEDGDDIIVEVDYENAEQTQPQEVSRASVMPAMDEEAEPHQVTHVAFIPEGQKLSPSPQVAGIRMTGAQEIAIVEERFRKAGAER